MRRQVLCVSSEQAGQLENLSAEVSTTDTIPLST